MMEITPIIPTPLPPAFAVPHTATWVRMIKCLQDGETVCINAADLEKLKTGAIMWTNLCPNIQHMVPLHTVGVV